MPRPWLLIFTLLLAQVHSAQEDDGMKLIGTRLPTRAALIKIASEVPSPPPKGFTMPKSVDLRAYMPPAGDQGKQNSCIAWALAYGLKTYQENLSCGPIPADSIGVMDPERIFSPAFAFNLSKAEFDTLDATCRNGTFFSTVFSVMVEHGCCTWSALPYEKNDSACFQEVPSKLFELAGEFKMKQPLRIQANDLQQLRYHLARNVPIAFSMAVDTSFMRGGLRAAKAGEPFVWNRPVVAPLPDVPHAMLLAGYDDADSTFLVLNSWGTKWGENGFGRIPYAIFQWLAMEAYIADDTDGATWAALPLILPSGTKLSPRSANYNEKFRVGESSRFEDLDVSVASISADKQLASVVVRDTDDGRHVQVLDLTMDRPIRFYHEDKLVTVHFDKVKGRKADRLKAKINMHIEPDGEDPTVVHCLEQVKRIEAARNTAP